MECCSRASAIGRGEVGTGFGQAGASGNTARGTGIGFSGTVFVKQGRGMAIFVEPEETRWN